MEAKSSGESCKLMEDEVVVVSKESETKKVRDKQAG
jgi:hypothetical protein